MPWLSWRLALRRARRTWRRSLQLRTIALTVVLSGVAIGIIGGTMAMSIGGQLYETRRAQILAEAERAVLQGQNVLDEAATTVGEGADELNVLQNSLLPSIGSAATARDIAILRAPDSQTPTTLQDTTTSEFPQSVLSDALRQTVRTDTEQLSLQPVRLERLSSAGIVEGTEPGLVVGASLQVPTAGQYELYLVYDLGETQRTLDFLLQILFVGSIALIALIGGVVFVVTRTVVGPVREAARTSEKLAAGELEERLPERGEDVLSTLARSFNRMADSLQRQITQLADLSRVQQRFVSDVSHELRTPLTTIRLAGDVLYDQRDDYPPATARTAELLKTQIERFELLLADLLEISRFDARAVELETEPTNLANLTEEAIETVQPLADGVGSELRLVAPGGHMAVEVDGRRIRRILRNLLGNAIEHGEGRPIVVTVDSNQTAVAIAVRDYGIGMTPEQAERVFDRFWRADPSRRRSIGGTGLGLAISLEDANLHDGRLDVWSEPGVGTCFRLTLPRDRRVPIRLSPVELPPAEVLDGLLPPRDPADERMGGDGDARP
ncbi:MtrAB system histidine kinase MtrB [Arenivirga flava]|uniref:Sensor histidine kinase MtrB n=1 Tax=Arenivirga flava TaxID=1930060 RepID=A0AA37UIT9_9MICO|nr:MtrAB system histidine kinase MtrB [Arenivirga flava]GMA27972.1 two-component sensor histidine kinase [Arenivirga flava]